MDHTSALINIRLESCRVKIAYHGIYAGHLLGSNHVFFIMSVSLEFHHLVMIQSRLSVYHMHVCGRFLMYFQVELVLDPAMAVPPVMYVRLRQLTLSTV